VARRAKLWEPNSQPQYDFCNAIEDELFYGGSKGGAKLISLDTPIATPVGWTSTGALVEGDKVFDENGGAITVLIAHPIEKHPEAYRVTFSDGSEILADGGHRWLTLNLKERTMVSRRTEKFRSRRRTTRLSRVAGNKSENFTAAIILRNKTINQPKTLPPPIGKIRTTKEIAETLIAGPESSPAKNHAVATCRPLQLLECELPLDPYLIGVWLGDGSHASGQITQDPKDASEVLGEFRKHGFEVSNHTEPKSWGVIGLLSSLRKAGVFRDKHIPTCYLRASSAQRLALVQGLMDTDGSVETTGSVKFTNTNRQIIDGMYELICSLGYRVQIREHRAILNGKDCGPVWSMKWTASEPMFRLKRKRECQKLSSGLRTRYRYIVSCERIAPVPMRCITVSGLENLVISIPN